jgi:hypothetical protein
LDSPVIRATGYGLNIRASIRSRGKNFLFFGVQTSSGARPDHYPWDIGGGGVTLLGLQQLGYGADHSHPSSAEVSSSVVIPPLTHMSVLN